MTVSVSLLPNPDVTLVESLTGKFRDECLNEHWFRSIAEAQQIIEAWRIDYYTVRPHRSLGQDDCGGFGVR